MPTVSFAPPAAWPAPYDPVAADRLVERVGDQGRAEARWVKRPDVAALLRCLGGNSPYLADLAARESTALRALTSAGPDGVVDAAMAALTAIPPAADRARVTAGLRRAKRVVALATAVADIGGIWSLARVTGALSALAEATLSLALAHLLRSAHQVGEIRLPHPDDPARDCGFTVLGMGKLGARELNFSSDIDLIALYDPSARVYNGRIGPDAIGSFTARLARGLVTLMEARDADGYVFRTDLRLRPDPASTPPAIAIGTALSYYESMGQNWERAAMIKARPVAGDLALGAEFLGEIRPFVWRRGLDFAAVAEIHAMRRRIDAHRGGALDPTRPALDRIAGHNVKLGEGGIREIEFLTQTLQLVWGGRDPALRDPTTLGALELLTKAGLVAAEARAELADSYGYLRRLEHRLQMINDRQTHDVPTKPEELDRLAIFMNRADAPDFVAELLGHLGRVRARYADVFGLLPNGEGARGADLDFRGDGPAPKATVTALSELGFTAPDRIVAAVRAWQVGRVRALRSERARTLLGTMLPTILARLAEQPDPDATFARFDRFLAGLPTGVQPLSLFERNAGLMDRLAAVLGAAPRLAEHMARVPNALEGLLTDEPARAAAQRLRAQLRNARVLEDCIEVTRQVVKEVDFAISVATLEGRLDADAAGLRRSALADVALTVLLGPVMRDFASRYGRVRGGGMVVVALGKAGGREMMAGSDLDLMMIYDHPEDVTESRGARAMPVSQWFVRAAHAFVAAVTAPGIDGPLYAVDMRLRPSGNKGPVAVSLSSFRRYHAEDAWTWERMALTRARVVAGPAALRRRVEAAIAEALAGARDNGSVRADALAMRRRMLRDLPADGPWDLKARPGGLVEVEFIAQALRLYHATGSGATRDMLAGLARHGALTADVAATLIRADRLWRAVLGLLRLTVGRWKQDALPEASLRPILRACQALGAEAVDLPSLRAILDMTAREVRAIFTRRIGEIEA